MTALIVYALIGLILAVLFGVGAYFLQGFVNDAPPTPLDLLWRAPAAALVVTLLTAWLCHLSRTSPNTFAPPLDYTAGEETQPVMKLTAVRGQDRIAYQMRKDVQGRVGYFDSVGRELTGRPDAIILEEEGNEVVFAAQKDSNGKFQPDPGQPLRYVAKDGRYIQEGYWGRISSFRSGSLFVYFLISMLHLAAWFVALWPLMRFPWAQALGLSLALWAAHSLLFLPLMTRASWWS